MINEGYEFNFKTLLAAAENGDLALLECTDKQTGKPVITICAIAEYEDGTVDMIPLAKMFDGNPYAELDPPSGYFLNEEDLH
jgi:hypothetical protein